MEEKTYTTAQLLLTDSELADVAETRLQKVEEHAECNGLGELYNGKDIIDCVCRASLKAYQLLVHARVPKAFRLSKLSCDPVRGLAVGRGMTSALVRELGEAIKRRERCIYCTAEQLVAWCSDERRENHAIWLDRLRGCKLIAVDDLHRLTRKFETPATGILRSVRDNGARLIGAGEPPEGWDVFKVNGEIARPRSVGWKTESKLEFYELGRFYGIK